MEGALSQESVKETPDQIAGHFCESGCTSSRSPESFIQYKISVLNWAQHLQATWEEFRPSLPPDMEHKHPPTVYTSPKTYPCSYVEYSDTEGQGLTMFEGLGLGLPDPLLLRLQCRVRSLWSGSFGRLEVEG